MAEADAAALSRVSRQGAIRSAILRAGRSRVERLGVPSLSLSTVAAEAGLNPSTVFGQFRNKDDLLLAILAEDLAMLAAAMRHKTVSPLASAHLPGLSMAEAGDLPPPATNHLPIGSSDEAGETEGANTEDAPTLPMLDAEKGPADLPSADSIIGERVLLLENALANIEHGITAAEATAARALMLSEESMKTVFDRMESFERQQKDVLATLMQRLDETERRQRGMTSELRGAISDAATRIEMLESARRTHAGQLPMDVAAEAVTASAGPGPQSSSVTAENENGAYREAAERATSAAATLVAMETAPSSKGGARPRYSRIRLQRRHWLFATCSAILMFTLGGSIAFSLGEVHGHQLASGPSQIRTEPLHGSAGLSSIGSSTARLAERDRVTPPPGNARTELLQGLQYLRGHGVAPDISKAAALIQRAATQDQPLAEYWLGALYEHGDGVPVSAKDAVHWYQAAAMQGNRKAMHAMGVAYAQGSGIGKNYSEAARWFTKAAQLGLVNSEFNLGVLFERGLGVPQNLANAYRWYAIAAAQGDQESRARIEALKTQLKPQDLAAAERSAADFHPLQPDPGANDAPAATNLALAH